MSTSFSTLTGSTTTTSTQSTTTTGATTTGTSVIRTKNTIHFLQMHLASVIVHHDSHDVHDVYNVYHNGINDHRSLHHYDDDTKQYVDEHVDNFCYSFHHGVHHDSGANYYNVDGV
ncbi:hypothetical protein LTR41_008495 [Exophiala xenobiotica]|nr:hypothetical protein LTR41_008495 [Exophiala xenobiotica]KAK5251349.1 hypothetical protein LTS06_003910 [Exophiala xenobiotica]KAK5287683.1 hypothetical protein LTR14_008913 [Exophiala xenobiotica]KAK5318550.1 hypothetical protein LTR93_007944 [Exophiala xenobiotica]KAK5400523.1 hypothetical protein LTR79_002624 [Exophiala xenobiotica]